MIETSIDIRRAPAAAAFRVLQDSLVTEQFGSQLSEAAVDAGSSTRASRRLVPSTRADPASRWTARGSTGSSSTSAHKVVGGVSGRFLFDGKASSMEAPACTAPVACGTELASRERRRSDVLRSMFTVCEWLFHASSEMLEDGRAMGRRGQRRLKQLWGPRRAGCATSARS